MFCVVYNIVSSLMTLEKTSKSTWITQVRTYRLWPCDKPRTPRKPRREHRLVIIDLHMKRSNSIGWCMLQVLQWWFLFVPRYTISSFIKRLNFSNCAEWACSALERCHERLRCARDFLAKTRFSRAKSRVERGGFSQNPAGSLHGEK